MTARSGSAPAAAPWPPRRRSWSPPRSPRAPAARSSWSRSRRTATPSRAPLDPDRRHRRLRQPRCATRCSPARSTSPSTRSRTCRPPRADGVLLAAVPPREDPRDVLVARDGLTLGELPPGARSAPGRRAGPPSCARSASASTSSRSAATSTPGCGWSPTASSTPSCWPAPGWPGSAGSTRSPRCSTRSRCFPPPARGRWRVECRGRTTRAAPSSPAAGSTTPPPGRRDRRAHPARRPGGRLLGPRRGPRPRSAEGERRPRAVPARAVAQVDGCTAAVRDGPVDDAGAARPSAGDELLDAI